MSEGFVCCPPDVCRDVMGDISSLPKAMTRAWVRFAEGSAAALAAIGVPVLSSEALLTEFLLPSFGGLANEVQASVKRHIRTQWSFLKVGRPTAMPAACSPGS